MATKTHKTIQELFNDSITINAPIRVTYFTGNEETYIPDVAKFNGCYASNNSTLAYVDIEGTLHVTPFTHAALKCLQENGFTEKFFYVPFSNGDYPTAEKSRWEFLRKAAKKEYEEKFTEDCLSYCEKNNIHKLSEDVLSKCFEIPKTGVRTKKFGYEDTYYPVITTSYLDCMSIEKLGKFCYNNGKVVFIHCDGKTYLAKGYKILDILRNAGYRQKGFFVPLSNGEEILDPYLADQWNKASHF